MAKKFRLIRVPVLKANDDPTLSNEIDEAMDTMTGQNWQFVPPIIFNPPITAHPGGYEPIIIFSRGEYILTFVKEDC